MLILVILNSSECPLCPSPSLCPSSTVVWCSGQSVGDGGVLVFVSLQYIIYLQWLFKQQRKNNACSALMRSTKDRKDTGLLLLSVKKIHEDVSGQIEQLLFNPKTVLLIEIQNTLNLILCLNKAA